MSWAKIKKAINSTLGTKDFKPLDKLILGEKRFVAQSDIVLHSFISGETKLTDYFISDKFVSKLNGTLLLKIGGSGGGSTSYTYRIYENGVEIYKSGYVDMNNKLKTHYLNVVAGNKYHIHVTENYSGTTYLTTLQLCGMVMDTNYFEIESGE